MGYFGDNHIEVTEKIKEALKSVMPIFAIVMALCLNVSIVKEKEVVLIVAKSAQKSAIMKTILQCAGPQTEAGTIVFSLPISEVAGFGMFE